MRCGWGNLLAVGESCANAAEGRGGALVNRGRGFLFLQGMATRFFERLGQALIGRGYAVYRVNFNGGGRAFLRVPGGAGFFCPPRGTAAVFPPAITVRASQCPNSLC